MKISKQAQREAKALFKSCQVDDVLDDNRVRQSVRNLIDKKPRSYLAILSHMLRLVNLDIQRRTARVESVLALDPATQAHLQSSLQKQYGQRLHFSFVQNPALLGGMRVRVGSDVYDGSVQGRLEALRNSF